MTNLQSRTGKIFIRGLTVLDCAVLLPDCGPRGRSWYVDVSWQGELDEEGVVVDFSAAKKLAKAAIDEFFDHRLLVAQSSVRWQAEGRVVVAGAYEFAGRRSFFALDSYADGLAVLEDAALGELSSSHSPSPRTQLRGLCEALGTSVFARCPANVKRVDVALRAHEEQQAAHYFSYTHSLRQHAGNCQRFHGHGNIIEVLDPHGALDAAASAQAARLLDGCYLVAPDYVVTQPRDGAFARLRDLCPELANPAFDLAYVKYQGSQGEVALILPRAAVMLTQTESTIENIAGFVHARLGLSSAHQVCAYEGLAKGALFP